MEFIKQSRVRLKEISSRYSGRQKAIAAVSAVFLVSALLVGYLYMSRPEWVTLYSNVDPAAASQIKTKLDEAKVPYKIDKNNILVHKDQIDTLRIDLAGEGIPNAKFDFTALLNRNSMFLSDDEKQQAYQLALQNELGRIISTIPGIEDAAVTLSIPKNQDFILQENRQKPKASVLLTLKSTTTLPESSIDGISRLLASSVEGLELDQVSVLGSNGQMLSRNGQNQGSQMAGSNLEMEEQVRRNIQDGLTQLLAPIYGAENISVRTSVKLNFDTDTTQSKIFEAPVAGETEGILRSSQESAENVVNGQNPQGAAGVNPNQGVNNPAPTYVTQDAGGNSTYAKTDTIRNYEINETIKNLEKAKGQIQAMSVAVVLNSDVLEGNELSEEAKEQVVAMVKNASFPEGASVVVSAQPFAKTSVPEQRAKEGEIPLWSWLVLGAVTLLTLGALGAFLWFRRRRLIQEQQLLEEQESTRINLPREELEQIEVEIKESGRKKSIENLIDKNPEIVTQLLKTWLDAE